MAKKGGGDPPHEYVLISFIYKNPACKAHDHLLCNIYIPFVLILYMLIFFVHGPRALSLVVVELQYDHDPVQTLLLYLEVKTALVIPSKL